MNKNKSKDRPCYVIVDGEKIRVDETEFINIEEDMQGRDLMTFKYKGIQYQSYILRN